MNCRDAQASLVDLLYEELDAEGRSRVLAHLEGCDGCRARWRRLESIAAAADGWTPPPLPRGIAERALARVAVERAREARRTGPHLAPGEILLRVALGAGAALVSLLLVVGFVDREVTPLAIGVLGVAWTLLYSGLLLTASHVTLRPIAWSALAGAGIAVVLVPPLSVPSVVEACARLVQAAPGSVAFTLLLMVVAAGYTAGPLLVGGLAFGRGSQGPPLAAGARLSILYALLVAPAVYLQCLALPPNVAVVWLAGAILGVALAGPASVGLAAGRARHA